MTTIYTVPCQNCAGTGYVFLACPIANAVDGVCPPCHGTRVIVVVAEQA
ncbi:MAG: hypothetical protein Q7O66_13750 [Dehalococcoidia bacterium]|nr:hypothetical protein [Dehalococcoidia bacterium]